MSGSTSASATTSASTSRAAAQTDPIGAGSPLAQSYPPAHLPSYLPAHLPSYVDAGFLQRLPPATADDSGVQPRMSGWLTAMALSFEEEQLDATAAWGGASTTRGPATVRSHTSAPSLAGWMDAQAGLSRRASSLEDWGGAADHATAETMRVARAATALASVLYATRNLFETVLWSADGDPLAPGAPLAAAVTEVHRWVTLVVEELDEYAALERVGEETWGVAGRAFTEESALHVLCQIEPTLSALEAGLASASDRVVSHPAQGAGDCAAKVREAIALVHEELRSRR